jgi:hypothetical protein
VGWTSIPSPSAQVPPVVVGTFEEPSTVKWSPFPPSWTICAVAGCVSCSSWMTTAAHSPSMSPSEIRLLLSATNVSEPLGPRSVARLPPSATESVQGPLRVTVAVAGPGTRVHLSSFVVGSTGAGDSAVPPSSAP